MIKSNSFIFHLYSRVLSHLLLLIYFKINNNKNVQYTFIFSQNKEERILYNNKKYKFRFINKIINYKIIINKI